MPAACSSKKVVTAPGTSGVIRKTVQPNSKFPVTSFLFFMHALCAHAQIYSKYKTDCPVLSCNLSILLLAAGCNCRMADQPRGTHPKVNMAPIAACADTGCCSYTARRPRGAAALHGWRGALPTRTASSGCCGCSRSKANVFWRST